MSNLKDWLGALESTTTDEEAEVADKKKYKVDMYKELLPALDAKDKMYYSRQSDERKAEIEKSMWIMMRNMSSSNDHPEHHILMVNDIVNADFSLLTKKVKEGNEGHPELQWMLMAMCGAGSKQFHPFVKVPKGIRKNKLEEAVLVFYPLMKDSDLELLLSINTDDDLKAFFKDNGYDDDTIKEIFTKGK